MSSIGEITYANQYVGNSNLGGSTIGAFTLDTKPLDDMAKYTFLYNKAMYEDKQKKAEATAKSIADLTKYDLGSAIPKDRDILQKSYGDLINMVRTDPSVMDYDKNPKGYIAYNQKKNELDNQIKSATTRSTLYATRQQEVDDTTDPDLKRIYQQNLDKEANNTDINTPLHVTAKWDIAPVAIPEAQKVTFDVTDIGKNYLGSRTWTMPDMKWVNAQAGAIALGLDKLAGGATSQDPLEQEQYKMQAASGKLEPVESANNFNAAIATLSAKPEYKNADQTVNWDKVRADATGLTGGMLQQVDLYNKRMQEMQTQITNGSFEDHGKQLSFGANGLNKDDYKPINLNDGLQPDELVKMRMLAKSDAASYKTKVDYTGAGTKQFEASDLSAYRQGELANQRKHIELEGNQFDQKKKEWAAQQTGKDEQKNGAMIKAARIYNELKDLATPTGFITPDKIRKLNQEQLQYLGGLHTITDGNGAVKTEYMPLNLAPTDAKGNKQDYVIQLNNGNINVLTGATPIKDEKGLRYEGLFDPTKSTNVYHIGTNILNDELKNAGSNELNAYVGPDVTGQETDWTKTTNNVRSGSSGSDAGAEKTATQTPAEATEAEVAQQAAASGYSPKEYRKLLIQKGIKIKK